MAKLSRRDLLEADGVATHARHVVRRRRRIDNDDLERNVHPLRRDLFEDAHDARHPGKTSESEPKRAVDPMTQLPRDDASFNPQQTQKERVEGALHTHNHQCHG